MRNIFFLLGGVLYLSGTLSAQQPVDSAPRDGAIQAAVRQRAMEMDHDPDHGPYVPLAEAEWKRLSTAPDRTNSASLPIPQAPKEDAQAAPAGTISVRAMQHPLSPKSRKLLDKAASQIQNHEDDAAAATIESALKLEDARPGALAMSGSMQLTAYIHTRNVKILSGAIAALMEAAQTLSDDPSVLSNLGMAFYLAGDPDRAFVAASKALQSDPSRAKTRYVLGLVLVWQHKFAEATYHLKLAAAELPAAETLLKRLEQEQLAAPGPTVAQK